MISPLSVLKRNRSLAGVLVALVCLLPCSGAFSQIHNPFTASLPFSPASSMTNLAASLINPVYADYSGASLLTYRPFTTGYGDSWNHQVVLGGYGFTFSYTRFNSLYDPNLKKNTGADTDLYSISKGFMFGNSFGFGLGYSFSEGTRRYDGYNGFSFGLVLRPVSFLSFGYTIRDFSDAGLNGEEILRSETYSLSLRPLGERLTLSLDAMRYEKKGFDDRDIYMTADILFPMDISLYVTGTLRNSYYFGVSIPMEFQSDSGTTMLLEYNGAGLRKGGPWMTAPGISILGDKYRSSLVIARAWLKIAIGGDIKENPEDRLFQETPLSFHDILLGIEEASRDGSIAGIIMVVDDTDLGFAQIQELRAQLKSFRRSGRKVVALMTSSANKAYYLSTAADKIYLAPGSSFAFTGLVAEVYFFKTLLDKIGVKFESVRKGKYKSFNEPFSRKGMSDDYRENLKTLLSDLNDQYIGDIARDRKLAPDTIRSMFKRGFLKPGEAVKSGFIDGAEYPDTVEKRLTESDADAGMVVGLRNYLSRHRRPYRWGSLPAIAVIHVSGTIVRGNGGKPAAFMPDAISDEAYRNSLRSAFGNPDIKAVIIRINSGGGSALASDFMWHYLVEMKKRFPKPVIISFGNMAASGGYYIACSGDPIFANSGTITGSIGVILGKVSLRDLYEKIGINRDVISLSEFADVFSEAKDMTPKEREMLQRGVDFTYRLFISRVMEARKIGTGEIDAAAQGRVFSGTQGKDKKLVDTIGGFMAAMEYARMKAGIIHDYEVIHYPVVRTPLRKILSGAGTAAVPAELRFFQQQLAPFLLGNERVLCLYPLSIRIK